MDENSLSHTSWDYKYHIVFAPKHRRQIICRKLEQDTGKILRDLCGRKDINIIEAECCPDYIHMSLKTPSKYGIFQAMGYLKEKSSLTIPDRHANLRYKYGNRHFWCRRYYVDTAGRNVKKIQDYVENRLKGDYMIDQISMREFIDPFTGEPVSKSKE